jgi:hypothetical protein
MFEHEGTLTTLAQLALTLTGFAALVSVYRTGQQKWTQHELIGQYIILELSLGATFFSVLPIALYYTNRSEANLWRLGSALTLLFGFGWLLVMIVRIRRVRKIEPNFALNPLIGILLLPCSLGMIVLLIFNLWLDSFSIYLWDVLWQMFIAGVQFIIFVYEYAQESVLAKEK